jgi:ketosteroid isomerase-like protein
VAATDSTPNESLPFGRASLSLATAIRDGDLHTAQSRFTEDACLITPDATAVYGRAEIRPILAQLIDAGTVIQVETGSLVRVGGLALGSERLHFRSRGVPHRQTFPACTVLRWQGNDWRIAIAAPWGWGHEACRCAESSTDMRRPSPPPQGRPISR